jgi:hypothetical protein
MVGCFREFLLLLVTTTLPWVCPADSEKPSVKVWATDHACAALEPALVEIARVPFPAGWTLVVACNETEWQMLQTKADAQATKHAFTNLAGRVTVLNGVMFLQNAVSRPAHRILLHEIGHIKCNCGDENKAERWALSLEKHARISESKRLLRFPGPNDAKQLRSARAHPSPRWRGRSPVSEGSKTGLAQVSPQ